jgi:hypothetical protein
MIENESSVPPIQRTTREMLLLATGEVLCGEGGGA